MLTCYEVQREEGTKRTKVLWPDKEIIALFHGKVLNSIRRIGLQRYLQRKFRGLSDEEREALRIDFISSIVYAYLSRAGWPRLRGREEARR